MRVSIGQKLKGSPTISFRDLAIQTREDDLVGASFGRGFYVLDDYSPLRNSAVEHFEDGNFHIFPVRRALWYVQADSLGGRYGFQGDSYYSADNPPYGATFTYFNGAEYKTKRQRRKAAESKQGSSDIETPGWDQLREESVEEAAQIVFEITDSNQTIVRRMTVPNSKGIHRVTWDFRCSAITSFGPGPLCTPGEYTVRPVVLRNGKADSLGEPVEFKVESVVDPALPMQDRAEVLEFLTAVSKTANAAEALRSSLAERKEQISSVRNVLNRSNLATANFDDQSKGD